jgi:hypothetical protein
VIGYRQNQEALPVLESRSTWHPLPVIATENRPTLAPSSPRGRLHHRSRRRKPGRTARDRAPPDTGHASGNCCLPGTRHPDQATVSPIGRQCAASPSTWPACRRSATRYRPTLAPLSLRGRLHRSRGRRPGRTAGVRVPPALTRPRQPRLASNPTPRPGHGTPNRQPVRCLAFDLARLPAICHPVPPDAGAVVASWLASPIERTKTRKYCRRSSTPRS